MDEADIVAVVIVAVAGIVVVAVVAIGVLLAARVVKVEPVPEPASEPAPQPVAWPVAEQRPRLEQQTVESPRPRPGSIEAEIDWALSRSWRRG
jgi:hypothetical protein